MTASRPSALKRALSYRKFSGPGPYRWLVPLTGYHLQKECVRALRQLGHTVLEVPVGGLSCAETIRALLLKLVVFKPDALLAINHLGFDDGHQLGDLLDDCGLPVACWYCDSPFFVMKNGGMPAATVTSLFVWEQTLLPTLRSYGAQDVHHLPLGCDPDQFKPQTAAAVPVRFALTFVGDSMRAASAQWDGPLGAEEQTFKKLWLARLSARARLQLSDEVAQLSQELPHLALWDALGSATFFATMGYRDEVIKGLPAQQLQVFGDAGWAGVLPPAAVVHPPVCYGPALAQVYAASDVSINATSLQMPTAVNQRVFDAPSAGGFVLSDNQDDLHALFDVGQEAIVYTSPEHLADLAHFYQSRPQLRHNISMRAQRRIKLCHTYEHRLQTIVNVMQKRYA